MICERCGIRFERKKLTKEEEAQLGKVKRKTEKICYDCWVNTQRDRRRVK